MMKCKCLLIICIIVAVVATSCSNVKHDMGSNYSDTIATKMSMSEVKINDIDSIYFDWDGHPISQTEQYTDGDHIIFAFTNNVANQNVLLQLVPTKPTNLIFGNLYTPSNEIVSIAKDSATYLLKEKGMYRVYISRDKTKSDASMADPNKYFDFKLQKL